MDPHPAQRRATLVWTLMAFLLLQGIGAIGGGGVLVASPDGAIMHMPVSNMRGSPFADYLIPGLILLLVLGVFPLVVLAGLWRRQAWAWFGSFAVGCGLIIWIAVEMVFVPFDILQAIFGAIGVLIALLTLLSPVRRYCGVRVLGGA
jgi:hypothetical protein